MAPSAVGRYSAPPVHDQDRVVDDRAHQDQEAQHGNHVEGLHDGGQADQWQQAANSVQHPQPDDATGNTSGIEVMISSGSPSG